jgi:Spy/CpxP family protein refolding chaperone
MRGGRLLAAALFVVGMCWATMSDAQRPGAQKGKGGQGGFQGRGGFMDVNTLILSNEALQEEVKITSEQKDKFKPVAEKQTALNKKTAEMFQGGAKGKGKGGFDKDKMTEMQKEREAVTEEAKKVVDTTLTTEQKTRLKQIGVQAMNVRAFTNEEVVTALKLTDEQKDKIKGISEEYNKDAAELRPRFGQQQDAEKAAENQKKLTRLQRETVNKAVDSLTAEQKSEWTKIVGEPFDTSKLIPQPRRKD